VSLLFGSRRPETRAVSYQDVFGSGGDVDLIGTGVEGALRLVPLFAAIRLITDQFASTPLHAYRERTDGTRERMPRQPTLLTTPPWGSMASWKGQCITSLLTWGNAYGLVTVKDGFGRAEQIQWLSPSSVSVDDELDRPPAYWWNGRDVPLDRMVHIPWIVLPGRSKGLSPVGYFKMLWETGQAAQLSSRDWYVNGAVPSVHFKNVERTLTTENAATMKARYKDAVQGRDALVTGKDWTLDTIGLPADEARFIEALKLTATQVASIYGIPPEEIGGERGASLQYSTMEMDDLRLSGRTMRPWYVRVEEALSQVRPPREDVKFNADALVRADLKTRMDAHEVAQRAGIETNAEARHVEDKPPMTDAERAQWLQTWHPTPGTPTSTREER
jgi:HK97 family phage portal protein